MSVHKRGKPFLVMREYVVCLQWLHWLITLQIDLIHVIVFTVWGDFLCKNGFPVQWLQSIGCVVVFTKRYPRAEEYYAFCAGTQFTNSQNRLLFWTMIWSCFSQIHARIDSGIDFLCARIYVKFIILFFPLLFLKFFNIVALIAFWQKFLFSWL